MVLTKITNESCRREKILMVLERDMYKLPKPGGVFGENVQYRIVHSTAERRGGGKKKQQIYSLLYHNSKKTSELQPKKFLNETPGRCTQEITERII